MLLGLRLPFPFCGVSTCDALMRAVFACGVAKLAADAQIGVNLRDDLVIQIEIAPIHHIGNGAAAKILDGAIAVVVHVGVQAVGHILDNAKAVVHGGGADLHAGGAQRDVLGRVRPRADAADADDWNFYLFRHRGNQVQGDGLHGRSAVAAMRRLPRYVGARRECFEVNTHQRIDRID